MRRSIKSPIIWAPEFLRKTLLLVPWEDPANLDLVANSATIFVLCPLMISFVIIILSRNLPSLVKESVHFFIVYSRLRPSSSLADTCNSFVSPVSEVSAWTCRATSCPLNSTLHVNPLAERIQRSQVSMDHRFYDSYRPDPVSRPQRQAAVRDNRSRSRVEGARVSKPPIPTQNGGIPPRKSSLESNRGARNTRSGSTQFGGIPPRKSSFGNAGGTKDTRNRPSTKRVPDPLVLIEEEHPSYHSYEPPHQPSFTEYEEPPHDYQPNICHDLHHQDHETAYQAHLHALSHLTPSSRLHRAQNIFLNDSTARPILTLGRPTWSSPTLRMHLYNGTLNSHTSTIHSPRTRTRFLDWQNGNDDQTHTCWHGIDTYDLNPRTRQAREELVSGLPTRIMPASRDTLRLLTRRATLDILTPAERQHLVEWWEHHHGRKVTTPAQRKFP